MIGVWAIVDYENLPDGIKRFITCVMGMALDELARIDPEFVETMDEIYRVESIDLVHSKHSDGKMPLPGGRLGEEWHNTLESILDLYATIQALELTTNLIGSGSVDPDEFPIGVMVDYHLANWWPTAQSVVEKTGVSLKNVLRRTGLPKKTSRPLEDALMSDLDKMQIELEKRRDPDLHGGPGNLFEAITEDGLWEMGVALRMSPAITIDNQAEQAADRQQLRMTYTRRNTDFIYDEIAKVLDHLCDELGCDRDLTPLRSG